MKSFVSILAAAILAGLGVFFLFDRLDAFALLNNVVMINVAVFVGLIAAMTIGAAALSTLFHAAIARQDRKMVGRLEARISALENGRGDPAPATTVSPPARPD